jgi:5,10-methylenetetrahydromethanopterin reductase
MTIQNVGVGSVVSEVGYRVPPIVSLDELADFAIWAHDTGADSLWFPDSQLVYRDVFAVLGHVAARTDHLLLGTLVTNVETRDPTVLGSIISTLEELAPGRFRFGFGAGKTAVVAADLRPTSGSRLEERLRVIKDLTEGRPARVDDATSALASPRRSRIYLAARGPRNTRLAGAIADGAIFHNVTDCAGVIDQVALVAEGAVASGRDPVEVDLVLAAHTYITDDPDTAAVVTKPILAVQLAVGEGRLLSKRLGIDMPHPPAVDDTHEYAHATNWEEAVDRCSWIPDEVARAYAQRCWFVGTAADVVTRMEHIAAQAGVRRFVLQHVDPHPPWSLVSAITAARRDLLSSVP